MRTALERALPFELALNNMAPVAFAVAVVAVTAYLVAQWLFRPRYEAINILTAGEQRFRKVLMQCLPHGYTLSYKPRIADIVKIKGWNGPNNRYFYRISSKHVDFVVLREPDLAPVAIIELDDKSHGRRDRKQRDRLVDRVFATAGIPMIHVPVVRQYNIQALRKQIAQAVR